MVKRIRMQQADPSNPLDLFLPRFDVSDTVACVVEADARRCWRALMEVDLIEVGKKKPLVAALGAIRMLPDLASHLLHGEGLSGAPDRMRLKDMAALPAAEGGWVLLDERPGESLLLGLVGKFWRPVIEYTAVEAPAFLDFDEPDWAKTIYCLAVEPLDDQRTLMSGTMRTATTSDAARRWFRRYWTFGVGSGAHVLVNGLLEVVRDMTERPEAAEEAE
jgi:hypothetical protein